MLAVRAALSAGSKTGICAHATAVQRALAVVTIVGVMSPPVQGIKQTQTLNIVLARDFYNILFYRCRTMPRLRHATIVMPKLEAAVRGHICVYRTYLLPVKPVARTRGCTCLRTRRSLTRSLWAALTSVTFVYVVTLGCTYLPVRGFVSYHDVGLHLDM